MAFFIFWYVRVTILFLLTICLFEKGPFFRVFIFSVAVIAVIVVLIVFVVLIAGKPFVGLPQLVTNHTNGPSIVLTVSALMGSLYCLFSVSVCHHSGWHFYHFPYPLDIYSPSGPRYHHLGLMASFGLALLSILLMRCVSQSLYRVGVLVM